MEEEIALYLEAAEEGMQNSLSHLRKELQRIRSGKASPDMLSGVRVDYYGSLTPISQVANIKAQDGRTLVISPWEKSMVQPLEQALFQANLGITPQSDGEVIRMVLPMLTEERRKELIKKASTFVEQAKVGIRSSRREAIDEVKKAVKNGYPEDAGKDAEATVQKLTDKYVAESEAILKAKEKDIMTI